MTTYSEWLEQFEAITGKRAYDGSFILQSYFRRGISPAKAATLYQPIVAVDA